MVRKLNQYLKQKVPFFCRAARGTHREVHVRSEIGTDLTPYLAGINKEFGTNILDSYMVGDKNCITLVVFKR